MDHRLARRAARNGGLVLLAWAGLSTPPDACAQSVAAPVLEWTQGGCRTTYCRTGWYASPAVADIDRDGKPEVIWSDYRIVVVRGEDGANEWVVDNPAGSGRTWPDPIVIDIDGDGHLEVVAAHHNGFGSVTRDDGTAQPGWPRQLTSGGELRSLAVGDVDGNGDLEIAVASTVSDNQWFVLEHTGATRAGWPRQLDSNTLGYAAGAFNQNVGLADIDGDGALELIGPNDTHYVSAFRHDGTAVTASPIYGLINGAPKPWARVGFHYLHTVDLRGYANCGIEHRPNFADSAPTFADVDGDGSLEIIIVGNTYDCAADPYRSLFHSPYVLRADRTRWAAAGFDWTNLPTPEPSSAPLSEDYNRIESVMPNPVVADIDGDGRQEILYSSYDGRLHAYWLDRTEHGAWPYDITRSGEGFLRFSSPPVVVDVDNDGQAEVIVTTWTEKGSRAGGQLLILSSMGALLRSVDLPRSTAHDWDGAMASPTVANIDADADLEVVVGTAHTGLVAYRLPGSSSARILWGTGRGGSLRTGSAPSATIRVDAMGVPNPVGSGQAATLSVAIVGTMNQARSYAWSASCAATLGGNGTFSDIAAASPRWTAPRNPTGSTATCEISVTVGDGTQSATGTYSHAVAAEGATIGFVRYFAEGATIAPFESHFALLNPSDTDTSVVLRFLRGDGQTMTRALTVPAWSRRTVDAKTVAGLENAEFSTVVESALPIVADRTMRWGPGGQAAHAETSIAAPSATWFLAEGATHSGFDLFYTVQNPNAADVAVTVRYLRPGGLAPLEKTYVVPAASRYTIWADVEQFPEGSGNTALASTDVSARFDSTLPIIVERSMYLSTRGQAFRAGTSSAGVTAPATHWFLAEGATGSYFDLFILIANPNSVDARVRGTFLLPDGTTRTRDYLVPANSRFNVWVDEEQFPDGSGNRALADSAVSTTMVSLDGVPIIVERSMWWPGPTAATWAEAHNSMGSTTTGTVWALADGEQGGAAHAQTYLTIANTSGFVGQARVTLLFEDGTPPVAATVSLPANSRTNVFPPADFPALFPSASTHRRFGALVESLGTTPAQIVVERPMYWDANGVSWAAGTNATGTRIR